VLAAQALGRLGTGRADQAAQLLETAAQHDAYALVREAALTALASFDKGRAAALAARMATADAEPRVRETATKLAASP
jgi:hypothetical protein